MQVAFMTTSEIISHLGFGKELTPQLVGSLPNYIHMLKHMGHITYPAETIAKKQHIKFQCQRIANQYKATNRLEEQKEAKSASKEIPKCLRTADKENYYPLGTPAKLMYSEV